jgi:iron(III) transport system substrate-binding protein
MKLQVWRAFSVVLCGALAAGCLAPHDQEVVVYTALDQEFSEPIFEDFTRETGIRVRAKFDTEATKTVGLAEAIVSERNRPRCDLFWNNEILNTLRLDSEGLLEVYRSPAAAGYPAMARPESGLWHGFAARARVLLINTHLVAQDQHPTSIRDLADPRWQGRVGIAKPLFGTTATHAACLFAYWGDAPAREFFLALKKSVNIMSGNKQVAQSVASGQLAFGLTDTDDAIIEIEKGMPVAIIYPDQQEGGMGTLFIPNTLAVIRGAPHREAARRLVDYLLSPQVETRLAQGASAQIPLNPEVTVALRIETPATIRPMQIDFAQAAQMWSTAAAFLRDTFTGAE